MRSDIPDVLAAIIMLIALLPGWGRVIVGVIVGFIATKAAQAWWRKRQAAQQRGAGNAPGSGGASAGDSAQQERP